MIIERVDVKNYRCIKDESLKCDNLIALLGRNGSGKSSFLYALDTFYDITAPVSKEDFFNRDTEYPIEIRVTYGSLRDDEREEFSPYIRDDKLIITKRISYENDRIIQKYYSASLQIPKFASIRSLPNKTAIRSEWNNLIDQPGDLVGLGPRARSADEVEQFMSDYESNHQDLLEPFEKEQQFFGAKNIGGGKLDKFTKYVLIPAVKEATDEASGRKGAIYQILDTIVLRKVEARQDIQEFKTRVSEEAKSLYRSDNLTELPELGESISITLEMFAPGSKLKLDWQEFEMPDIKIPAAMATLIEDNFEGEISRKGHGLQRALIFTLLQHLALLMPEAEEEEERETSEHAPTAMEAILGPDLILAIEEPELYLHPSRCRYMCDLLFKLAEEPGHGLGTKNQVIYTTHSPFLLDLDHFEQIRLIGKKPSEECDVPHSCITSYTFQQLSEELSRICDLEPHDITRDSIRARATSVMNTIVNEGFFSDVVVVVEGPSDVGVLWKMQDVMDRKWSQFGIVVVPAGGKNNLDRPTLIFRGLSIPTYFIFDADSRFKGKGNKNEADTITRNKRCLCLANAAVEDFPETQVHENWAVFGDNMESELRSALGKDKFEDIRKQVADELGYTEAKDAMKNIEGATRFIEYAYRESLRIPVLEDIVEKVTALHQG